MASRVSSLKTSAWQQQFMVCSDLGNTFDSRSSNVICLVTAERSKSCDKINFVKLNWN